jgi:hypothetical protein
VKAAIEKALPLAGRVRVFRGHRDDQGGYTWTISYLTAVGDLPQITVNGTKLTGIGRRAWTGTYVHVRSL